MQILDEPYKVCADNFTKDADFYILSHFHNDHTKGLRKGWNKGKIICSLLTAKLLSYEYGFTRDQLIILKENGTMGKHMKITTINANHCPGAFMFVINTDKQKIVFTGDFRYQEDFNKYKELLSEPDVLYVDSTYYKYGYEFPLLEDSIDSVIDVIRENPDKKIILAVYTIGKNKLLERIYKTFNKKIYLSPDKINYYRVIGVDHLVTGNKMETNIYAYSRFYLEKHHRKSSEEVVIMPTGLFHLQKYHPEYVFIPYSEHCSASELATFINMLNPKNVVRT